MNRLNLNARPREAAEQDKRVKDELDLWKRQREESLRRHDDPGPSTPSGAFSRRDAAVNAAKLAAGVSSPRYNNSTPVSQPASQMQYNTQREHSRQRGDYDTEERRLHEADNHARQRHTGGMSLPTPPPSAMSNHTYPASSSLQAPMAVRSRPPSFLEQYNDSSFSMPLESPYEGDSTDSEMKGNADRVRNGRHRHADNARTPPRPNIKK